MDTAKALLMGMQNRGKEMKVFDWDKAARIIAERKPEYASAGLRGDWEYTGGIIYEDGKPVHDDYTYLASTWATPELEIDGDIIACYVMESETEWDSHTKWPESALKILNDGRNLKMDKYELYSKICDRVEDLRLKYDRLTLMIDLESADKKFNIRLEEMLNSDSMDFMHDIYGIENNIVRDKFPATDFGYFVPRFAG